MATLISTGRTPKVCAIWGSEVVRMALSRVCMKNALATMRAIRRVSRGREEGLDGMQDKQGGPWKGPWRHREGPGAPC